MATGTAETTVCPESASPVAAALSAALGKQVSTQAHIRQHKARDRSYHHWEPPLAVVQPRSTSEVATAVRICAAHNTPVVPRGSGTGLEGGSNSTAESVCIDLSQMDQVLQIADEDMYARVQAGVMKSDLNAALKPYGMHFPPGPAIDASVGGMASTSASGTTAVNYGTLKENVLGLTAVLADGSVITTGAVTKKSSSGYDLTHLLVGAEGTLGIITEVTVVLHPLPETTAASVWSLPSLAATTDLVVAALKASAKLARVELLDDLTVEALLKYREDLRLPVAHTLMVEFEGPEGEVGAHAERFGVLAAAHGAVLEYSAAGPEQSAQLWQIRADVLPACVALIPGAEAMATDVCVPISRLAECILETQQDIEATGAIGPICGHVGDGNFHIAFPVHPEDEQALARIREINERLILRSLAMGGTCTGEHGIGTGKISSLVKEHGSAISTMWAIKSALDPQGIMNPGKVLPARDSVRV